MASCWSPLDGRPPPQVIKRRRIYCRRNCRTCSPWRSWNKSRGALRDAENVLSTKETIYMSTITTKDGTSIYYKDWGTGRPVTFSHGWPLSADAWDRQMMFLAEKGFRVIAHDR